MSDPTTSRTWMTRVAFPRDLAVRALGPRDLAAVIDLIGRCDRTYLDWAPDDWQPPDLGWYRERWRERLRDRAHWAKGAFDGDGAMRAIAAWRPERDMQGRPVAGVAHVGAVFVDPGRWREGIATALLELAEGAMRERGHRLARLWTPEGAPAERFYQARGWRPSGERDWLAELGLHVVAYTRPLSPEG